MAMLRGNPNPARGFKVHDHPPGGALKQRDRQHGSLGPVLFILTAVPILLGLFGVPAFAHQLSAQDEALLRIARVKYGGGGDWYSDPSSLPNLLEEFRRRTGIRTAPREDVVALSSEKLFSFPFLYLTGHGAIKLTEEEAENLRRYLLRGGFLFADDNYGMNVHFVRTMKQVFPEKDLEAIPASHPVFSCFYVLPGLPKIHEHDGKPPLARGIFHEGRLLVFYSHESDIGDGLEDPEVHGDPAEKRELAVRMATNVLFYALTQVNSVP